MRQKKTGINILLYGEPGTGKTEFAKTLAAKVSATLFSIGEEKNTASDNEEKERYAQINQAQLLLKKEKNMLLLIDEADDIFSEFNFFFRGRRENIAKKLQINRLLEKNPQPIIWILNDIQTLHKSYLRRFSYAINFKRPNQSVIINMWKKNLRENHLSVNEQTAKEFANKYSLAPSFIASAVKSAKLMKGGIKGIEHTLDVLQEVYNNGQTLKKDSLQKTAFNPDLLNTDVDLKLLARRLSKLKKKNFSLCLYGASGTGKSAFARYLAGEMQLPVIKKRCSDLKSKWVGETEKNIAAAFEEACLKEAVLIFDEADSFLQDRNMAQRTWEISEINEMLTQMETHPLPFVCTTNLMNRLDKAALRRFTFKVKYDYMTEKQRTLCFEYFFAMKGIDLSHLPSLTPGDFVVVKEKAEILDYLDNKDELIKMLELEQINKAPVSHKIGFI